MKSILIFLGFLATTTLACAPGQDSIQIPIVSDDYYKRSLPVDPSELISRTTEQGIQNNINAKKMLQLIRENGRQSDNMLGEIKGNALDTAALLKKIRSNSDNSQLLLTRKIRTETQGEFETLDAQLLLAKINGQDDMVEDILRKIRDQGRDASNLLEDMKNGNVIDPEEMLMKLKEAAEANRIEESSDIDTIETTDGTFLEEFGPTTDMEEKFVTDSVDEIEETFVAEKVTQETFDDEDYYGGNNELLQGIEEATLIPLWNRGNDLRAIEERTQFEWGEVTATVDMKTKEETTPITTTSTTTTTTTTKPATTTTEPTTTSTTPSTTTTTNEPTTTTLWSHHIARHQRILQAERAAKALAKAQAALDAAAAEAKKKQVDINLAVLRSGGVSNNEAEKLVQFVENTGSENQNALLSTQLIPGRDHHEFCCPWAAQGECNSNKMFMRPMCQHSCGTFNCKAERVNSCVVKVNLNNCQPERELRSGGFDIDSWFEK